MNIRLLNGAAVALVAASGLLLQEARAAGFQIAEQNASGLGSVYAGQAALAEDASAIFFNPAALTRLPAQRQLIVGGALVKPSSRFHDSGSCAPYAGTGAGTSACPFGAGGNLGHDAGGSGGDSSQGAGIPHLYAAWAVIPDTLFVGMGASVTFGLETERNASWVGRFHSVHSSTRAINLNPTVAYRVFDGVSVGAGVDLQRFDAKLTNQISYRAVALGSGNPALIGAVPVGAEGRVTVKGDDWGTGWNAGIDLRVAPAVHLGFSYRSRVDYKFGGTVRFDDRPAALSGVALVSDGRVRSSIELPETLSVALAWNPTAKLTLLGDWTRTGWSSISNLDIVRSDGPLADQILSSIPLRFQDSWRAGAGLVWQAHEEWALRTGYAHETSAVRNAFRTPRLPDSARDWFGLGARWRPRDSAWAVDAGFAYARLKKARSDLPNQATDTSPPMGSIVGTYQANAKIAGIQVTWSP